MGVKASGARFNSGFAWLVNANLDYLVAIGFPPFAKNAQIGISEKAH
jgi:hypothetical protein